MPHPSEDGTEIGSVAYPAAYVCAVRAIEQWAALIQREVGTASAAAYLARCGVDPARAHRFLIPYLEVPCKL